MISERDGAVIEESELVLAPNGIPISLRPYFYMLPSVRFLAVSLFTVFLIAACVSPGPKPAAALLTIEEYPLKSLECPTDPEARCFEPESGTFEEIVAKRQEEREKLADPMPWMTDDTAATELAGKPLVANLVITAEAEQQAVAVQVVHGEEVIYTRPLGPVSPLNPLQGLWVIDGHWYLEVVEHVPGGEYYARGLIIQDGELLNDRLGYREAFAFTPLRGKPFYLFSAEGRIYASLAGETVDLDYDEVAHYGCCSAARLNPIKAENMLSFFARRDAQWFYVEAGIYAG